MWEKGGAQSQDTLGNALHSSNLTVYKQYINTDSSPSYQYMEACVFCVGSTYCPHSNSPLVAFGLKLRILNTFLSRSKGIPERGRIRFVFCTAIYQIAKIRLMTDLIGDCGSM